MSNANTEVLGAEAHKNGRPQRPTLKGIDAGLCAPMPF